MPLSEPLRQRLIDLLRVLITVTMVALAAWSLHWAMLQQRVHPWTRDGQVLGEVVQVAPQVSGPVAAVHVDDNQRVAQGAPLFELDPALFRQALRQAEADLAQAQAEADNAADDARRAKQLHARGDLADEVYELRLSKAKATAAARDAAKVRVETARLKLSYTKVRAPVAGFVTNLELETGAYADAGSPLIALIDETSFWVVGYFKETELESIAVGDPAVVTLMANPEQPLTGQVESVAYGIARRNVGSRPGELAPVSPTFEWIRLAQRIPVRIRLDDVRPELALRIGYTASVAINPSVSPQPAPQP